ncbi:MAG TPA: hypothetical protein VIG99_00530 [Myxococcaceae bacterium]
MTSERVDKGWTKQGLGKYSTEAIFGSLSHYGAPNDEAAFKALAAEKYPLEIAEGMMRGWKGTGPWQRFPLVAVDELYGRLLPDRLPPAKLSAVLVELMHALGRMMEGAQDAPVGQKFKEVGELKPQVPLKDGKPAEGFVNEVLWRLGDWRKVLGRIVQDLSKDGHAEDAEEFLSLEEFLVPDWAGTTRALVRAQKGEKAEAVADLRKLAGDPSRKGEARAGAVDCLLQLEALDDAGAMAMAILDEAEKKPDFHLALEMGQRLAFVYEKKRDLDGMQSLRDRITSIQQAHVSAHPEHTK